MGLVRYSDRGFDPYESGRAEPVPAAPAGWVAPVASGPLQARMRLPCSKSLTNRELVLAALADGPSTLLAPLRSRDSALMIEGLRALGTRIEEIPTGSRFGPDLAVTPADELIGSTSIDTGLAGTVMRFLPPVAALALGPVSFDGDEGARRRPMRTTLEALRALGVDVNDDGRGALPFTVHGSGRVRGGTCTIDASASSQFVSGLLLAAARFDSGLELRHEGDRLPSLPHIEMTIAALTARGVAVEDVSTGVWAVAPGPIASRDTAIEPDLSNAGPFLAAALVAGGTVAVEGWPDATTQVGAQLERLLAAFGAEVHREGGALVVDGHEGVRGGRALPGVDLDLSEAGELAPTLVALAALAEGPSTITGIAHLRGHETDRLAALTAELNGLGGDAEELEDGLAIRPRPLHGGEWHAYEDHRMATAGALIGLVVPDVTVDDIGSTAKTLPEFPDLWRHDLLRGSV